MSFWTAWAIPGVAAFSLTLFFAKLVAYTFLYWLPCDFLLGSCHFNLCSSCSFLLSEVGSLGQTPFALTALAALRRRRLCWLSPGLAGTPFLWRQSLSALVPNPYAIHPLPVDYINSVEVGGRKLTPTEAGNLSILFDIGGVMGGVVAGALSDATSASALVSSR